MAMTGKAQPVAFIGLGVMGGPMAAHLAASGWAVTVTNRTQGKAEAWVAAHGGSCAASPAEAAREAGIVISCVGDDDDLRDVTVGHLGAFETMAPGTIFIDHSTVSAHVARELHERAARIGLAFLDAPVSGGEAGARQGTLSIMVGGDEEPFQRALPFLSCYGHRIERIGGPGCGQLTKMVNQICIAGLIQSLAEGLDFGRRAGLDMDRVLGVIGAGAAQSWQMENRARTMLEGRYDFGFAVDLMRKDLAICFEEVENHGARLDLAAQIDAYYAEIQAMGGGRWDTSSLMARLHPPASSPSPATERSSPRRRAPKGRG